MHLSADRLSDHCGGCIHGSGGISDHCRDSMRGGIFCNECMDDLQLISEEKSMGYYNQALTDYIGKSAV